MSPRPSSGVRQRIIEAAQQTVHERGYHGTSVDEVLARAGTTKGGMYHHFGDKESLVKTVVREKLQSLVENRWGGSDWHDDPITFLQGSVTSMKPENLKLGCPVNSLAQEVASSDDELRTELEHVFDIWMSRIADGLRTGILRGTVGESVDPQRAAAFFLAAWEGLVSLAKARAGDTQFVIDSADPLLGWLETLRATPTE